MSESLFQQDAKLDGTLMFAAMLTEKQVDNNDFIKIVVEAGISNPLVGIARGVWFHAQPEEYKQACLTVANELLKTYKAQVVS